MPPSAYSDWRMTQSAAMLLQYFQLYIAMSPDDTGSIDALFNCTDFLLVGPEGQRENLLQF